MPRRLRSRLYWPYCHHCGEAVINRYRFEIRENKLIEEKCPKCKNQIDGVGL